MEEVLRPDFQADELLPIGEDAVHQARYLEHMAHCPVYGNTVTEYFSLGEFCFARMIEELKKAERYIFVEYFIVEEGEMWNACLLYTSGTGLVDVCLCNSAPVRPGLLERYREEDAVPIRVDRDRIEAMGVEVVERPLASETSRCV